MQAMSDALRRAGLLTSKQEKELNNLEESKRSKNKLDQELMYLRGGSNNQERKKVLDDHKFPNFTFVF